MGAAAQHPQQDAQNPLPLRHPPCKRVSGCSTPAEGWGTPRGAGVEGPAARITPLVSPCSSSPGVAASPTGASAPEQGCPAPGGWRRSGSPVRTHGLQTPCPLALPPLRHPDRQWGLWRIVAALPCCWGRSPGHSSVSSPKPTATSREESMVSGLPSNSLPGPPDNRLS